MNEINLEGRESNDEVIAAATDHMAFFCSPFSQVVIRRLRHLNLKTSSMMSLSLILKVLLKITGKTVET